MTETEAVTETEAMAKTEALLVKQPYTRAANDPRLTPKPLVDITINTTSLNSFIGLPLDTTLAADITHTPKALERALNDPRNTAKAS